MTRRDREFARIALRDGSVCEALLAEATAVHARTGGRRPLAMVLLELGSIDVTALTRILREEPRAALGWA